MNFTVTEETVSALDRLQKDLQALIESLKPVKASKPETAAPAPKPETTLEEVRKVLVEKAREGKNAQVKQLLERFHAASLPEVDPADYADLLEMGKGL